MRSLGQPEVGTEAECHSVAQRLRSSATSCKIARVDSGCGLVKSRFRQMQKQAGRPLLQYGQLVVGAIEVQALVEIVDQARAVLGQEGQDGIEALLQMALRIDQS